MPEGTVNSTDWSLLIAVIAVVVSVACPVITTALNNRHEYKMWNLRANAERKNEVTQNYIRKTGYAIKRNSPSAVKEYSESYGEIFLFAPEGLWPDIEHLDHCICNSILGPSTNNLYVKICKALSQA